MKDGRSRVPVLHNTMYSRKSQTNNLDTKGCPDWVEIQRALVNALGGRLEMQPACHMEPKIPKPSIHAIHAIQNSDMFR